jgi:hypothetical protein
MGKLMDTSASIRRADAAIPQDARHCRYCRWAAWDGDGNYCAHTQSMAESDGFGRATWFYRSAGQPCGPAGRLFRKGTR